MKTTVILGASPKADRYSHLAHLRLKEAGHETIPVHPTESHILDDEVFSEVKDVWQSVDTLTVYVAPHRFAPLVDDVIRMGPRRIIFNPGTECPEVYHEFPEHIKILDACTLVMLNTGQY